MAWTDLSSVFGYGTRLASSSLQLLRDNITALANGDAGAPKINPATLSFIIGQTRSTTQGFDTFYEVLGSDGVWRQCSPTVTRDGGT